MGACSISPISNTTGPVTESKQPYVFPIYTMAAPPPTIVINRTDTDAVCLAQVIYMEARNQSQKSQLGVAFVTIHRATRHHNDVSNICQAVYADHQYSWTVKPQISHRKRPPNLAIREAQDRTRVMYELIAWERAQELAQLAMNNPQLNPVKDALYFLTPTEKPKWMHNLQKVVRIGAFIFYRDPHFQDPRG
jgi:spore germination cell wall hydrolase CwlJ-like protein